MAKSKVKLGDELMFPSEYLAAVEFKGRDVTLTIKDIRKEDLKLRGGKSERKPVIYFHETAKKLVCNVTNGDSIAAMYGSQAKDWVGKRITLYPTKTTCGRDTVDCIRVRETVPAAKSAPAQQPTPPDAGGFTDADIDAAFAGGDQ